jgi:glycosyltransferase involved in cell wall biosynthesis/GT2 family glycosyltransferase
MAGEGTQASAETNTQDHASSGMSDGHLAGVLVTVIIPARNEERFIDSCLDAVLAQDLPSVQVIVVDGDSDDATAAIVTARAALDDRVELISKPARIIPVSLNLALGAARGNYLVRIDAHTTVPPDYVRWAVGHLRTGRWGGVGRRKDGVGVTPAGVAVAAAMASRFGIGGSTYRHGTAVQPVEHIPFGAYPTALVRSLGGWDERLAVNQDFEFDVRVREAGHQLLFDPELVIHWPCRQSVPDLFRQYRRYGRGKVRVAWLHPRSLRVRHLTAPALVVLLAAAAGVVPRRPRLAFAALVPYLSAIGLASARTASPLRRMARPYVPAVFVAMHVGWGVGFWQGVLQLLRGDQPKRVGRAGVRPSVIVVAQGPPAQGGISSFATTIVDDPELRSTFDMRLLNTTREAVRVGGAPTLGNARNVLVDASRVFRASRRGDVVHVQTALMPVPPLLRALLLCSAARFRGAAALCHVHSGRVNSGRAEAFSPNALTRLLLKGLGIATVLLTCAEHGTTALRRLVSGVLVETVNNAADVSSFPHTCRGQGPVRMFFLGTLSHRKGVLDLLSACSILQDRGVDGWELAFVGEAAEVGKAEAQSLREAFSAVGLGGSLLGSKQGPGPLAELTADVFVLPSHWEGQPIAILEAMASGLPIVATTVGAVPDVVRDSVEGLLVEPHDVMALADALERVITDPALRRRLGAAAR